MLQDFDVQLTPVKSISNIISLTKPSVVAATNDLTITAEVNGRVASIPVKEGNLVAAGQTLMSFSDSIAFYNNSLATAGLNVSNAQKTLATQAQQIADNVANAKRALDQATQLLASTKTRSTVTLQKAALDLANAQVTGANSQASLSLSQTQLTLSNNINSFKDTFAVQKQGILTTLSSVLDTADTLLGVTPIYRDGNDGFETSLSAKNIQLKYQGNDALTALYAIRNQILNLPISDLTNAQIISGDLLIGSGYTQGDVLLKLLTDILNESVAGNSFPQTMIDSYKSAIIGLRASLQGAYGPFIAYDNQVRALLGLSTNEVTGTLADNQLSQTLKQIEIAKANAEVSYQNVLTANQDSILQAEQTVEKAQDAYNTAILAQTNGVQQLQIALQNAQIGYQTAGLQASKLRVTAPINAKVASVLVDVGQDVSVGTPLARIVSTDAPEVSIKLSEAEVATVRLGMPAYVRHNGILSTGFVEAITQTADTYGQYSALIRLPVAPAIGTVVDVAIPLQTADLYIPLEAVTPDGDSQGFIWLWQAGTGTNATGGTLIQQKVALGIIKDTRIEILTPLSPDAILVVSPVQNYDPTKFVLKPSYVTLEATDNTPVITGAAPTLEEQEDLKISPTPPPFKSTNKPVHYIDPIVTPDTTPTGNTVPATGTDQDTADLMQMINSLLNTGATSTGN